MAAKANLGPEQIQAVDELLHIAQGSDWFWWFGRENYTPDIAVFDNLFRQNLIKIHQILGSPVPEPLTRPIADAVHAEPMNIIQPRDYLQAVIDGGSAIFSNGRTPGASTSIPTAGP